MPRIFRYFLLLTIWYYRSIDSKFCEEQRSTNGFGYELLQTRLDGLEMTLGRMLDAQIKHQKRIIESCEDVSASGRYRLQLPGRSAPITVICEMERLDGGWTVIQRRSSGLVNFNRSWTEYRDGFGFVGQYEDYWLGLEIIHQLTKKGDQELLVQLHNETGHYEYGRYQRFQLTGENDGYKLFPLVEFHGKIGEMLNNSRDMKFSTYDRDNDKLTDGNCAQKYGGGWWYYKCGPTFLNGPFIKNNNTSTGIYWYGFTSAATYSRMLIRRR